jgi:hypothetical protein
VLTIFAGLASLERETFLQRTRGKHRGGPIVQKPKYWEAVHSEWKAGKHTAVQAMKILELP